MSGGLNEISKEELRIPVVRLMSQGQLDQEMMDIILLNMRKGDINAQIAACGSVSRRPLRRSPAGTVAVVGHLTRSSRGSRARMLSEIERIPDGRYTFEDVLDDHGLNAKDVAFRLAIEKKGQRIVFDWTGSDPQVPGNINLTFDATQSCVFFGLKADLDPDLPNNQGVLDAVASSVHSLDTDPSGGSPTGLNGLHPASGCCRPWLVGAKAMVAHQMLAVRGHLGNAGNSVGLMSIWRHLAAAWADAPTRGKDGVQPEITNTSNLPVEAMK